MLSVQEALLLKAAQDETEKQQAIQTAGILGSTGGSLLGAAAGTVPHKLGMAVNSLRGTKPRSLRPGFRMAGGLTGAILGGALGAGTAAVMKQGNQAAELLGKIQAKGTLNAIEEAQLADLLAEIYSNPSNLG